MQTRVTAAITEHDKTPHQEYYNQNSGELLRGEGIVVEPASGSSLFSSCAPKFCVPCHFKVEAAQFIAYPQDP